MIKRLRPGVSGAIRDLDTTYNFNTEFAASSTNTNARLLDAWVRWQMNDIFAIRFGQFRMPWGREFVHSATQIQLVDRSLNSSVFGLNRDIGVDLQSSWFDGKLRKHLLLVNGDGPNAISGDSSMLVASYGEYDIMGKAGSTVSDINRSSQINWLAGGGLAFDFGNQNLGGAGSALNGNKLFRAVIHSLLRYRGIGALVEGHFVRNMEIDTNEGGVMAQAGYMVYQDKLEAVARYSLDIVGDQAALSAATEDQHELSAGLNGFYWGQYLKMQVDYSLFLNAAATNDRTDHQVRTQLQFYF